MRVVVVGATGNVGTSVVEALAADEQIDTIVGIARRRPQWQPPKTTWIQSDISRDDLVSQFRGADAVVQLAWIFQPTHDELATWRNNVLGSIRVFEAAAQAGVGALVYSSSVGAYSPGPQDRGIDESWPTHALSTAAYGREKSYLERVLDTFERDHPEMRVVRLRPGFIFKRESAAAQRRLFAGPLVPTTLLRPALLPIVPDLPGLRLQALHSRDAGQAFRLAVVRPVRGAFNIAADPVLDARTLGELLGARPVKAPVWPVRAAVAAAWKLHLVPASPTLLDLALSLPLMDVTRARTELGWTPTLTSLDAIREFLDGLRAGNGMNTPPLEPTAGGRFRGKEVASGVGQRATP
ncbi:NAD-dependent epimerase [Mycobacterium sp. 1164966.3]|uniref:NAD-dependent epimerase/dehydratase family protein n=1 Tax=Mycobacterium sp. 1164966.3 TaxID=1856861 RepID=UPI0007FE71A2|nr:NAD-dependent epimerase/dehydratase family protein [Mycobacterium sp. 1164966.3]OBA81758.1 NAD-dependent epimerase [Mycobacterium sp. 1164966.3]